MTDQSQWTMYNGPWKSSPEDENLYNLKGPAGVDFSNPTRSSPKKAINYNQDLNQILKSLQNMKDSQKKRIREHTRKSKNGHNFNKTRGSFKANAQSRASLKQQKYSLKKNGSSKNQLNVGKKREKELPKRRPKLTANVEDLRDLKVMDHLVFDSKNWMERLDGLKQLNGCNININNNFININTLQHKEKGVENGIYKDKRGGKKEQNFEFGGAVQGGFGNFVYLYVNDFGPWRGENKTRMSLLANGRTSVFINTNVIIR